MARIQSVSLSNAEGKAIDDFLEIHKELNMNQLLKQALTQDSPSFTHAGAQVWCLTWSVG